MGTSTVCFVNTTLERFIADMKYEAVEEFAERLKDLLYTVYGKHGAPLGDLTTEDIAGEINALLKDYEK